MGVPHKKIQQGPPTITVGSSVKSSSRGFTIIEVVLFLGITGMLAVGLLGGWSTMINTQRYKDSVKTLQSFIQQQYNLVYNVENGRSPTLSCSSATVAEGGTASPRGQSNCVLMGRLIQVQNGTRLTVRSIVGEDLPESSGATSDIDLIRESNPVLIPESIDIGMTYNSLSVPWGATIIDGASNPRTLSIAIIRSPVNVSGSVHTYTVNGNSSVIDMINVVNERQDVPLCIESGSNFSGGNMGVVIKARASAQSYIQIITDEAGTC